MLSTSRTSSPSSPRYSSPKKLLGTGGGVWFKGRYKVMPRVRTNIWLAKSVDNNAQNCRTLSSQTTNIVVSGPDYFWWVCTSWLVDIQTIPLGGLALEDRLLGIMLFWKKKHKLEKQTPPLLIFLTHYKQVVVTTGEILGTKESLYSKL